MSIEYLNTFPGTITPLEIYDKRPNHHQTNFELALCISFCEGYLPYIQLAKAIEFTTQQLASHLPSNALTAIVSTSAMGLYLADHDGIVNDGKPYSHGIWSNDIDLTIIHDHRSPNFQRRFHHWLKQGVKNSFTHPGHNYVVSQQVVQSLKSKWNIPPYLKVQIDHGQTGNFCNIIHLHRQKVEIGSYQSYLFNYQPFYSTRLGAPMALGLPDHSGNFTYFLWNPTAPNSETGKHVRIFSPDLFLNSPRSILQTTRVALGTIIFSSLTGEPVTIHPDDIPILKESIARYACHLTLSRRKQAQVRYNTTLHRAISLSKNWEYHGPSDPVTYINDTLDEIGWRQSVLQ